MSLKAVLYSNMKYCGRAKDATVGRLLGIGFATLLLRSLDSSSCYRSFWSDFLQLGKEYIKEDKQALPDLLTVLQCEFAL